MGIAIAEVLDETPWSRAAWDPPSSMYKAPRLDCTIRARAVLQNIVQMELKTRIGRDAMVIEF